MSAPIHIVGAGEQYALCGSYVGDSPFTTAQPASSTCDDCFQVALEESGDEGYLGNPEGRKR